MDFCLLWEEVCVASKERNEVKLIYRTICMK